MREETRKKQVICAICKRPITRAQRPSVLLERGKEAHMECFAEQSDREKAKIEQEKKKKLN